jgi:hypothetical protein
VRRRWDPLQTEVLHPSVNELLDEPLGEWLVDGELQRALRGLIGRNVVGERREHRSAVGQVGQVVLECRESGDRLALQLERWCAIGEALLGFRYHLHDRFPQRLERASLWLVQAGEVMVDLVWHHPSIFAPRAPLIDLMISPGRPSAQDAVARIGSYALAEGGGSSNSS